MLDDPGDCFQRLGERFGIGDGAERAIENVMAAVGDERFAALARAAQVDRTAATEVGAGALDMAARRREAERRRPPPAAETRRAGATYLDASAMTIMRLEAAATIFSRSSAPPPPLMRRNASSTSSAPSTVRSSSGYSSRVASGTPSACACARVACEVGTPTIDRPPRDARAEQIDEMTRGRAAAEPQPHAGSDKFERATGGFALQPFGILQRISSVRAARGSARRAMAGMAYRLRGRNANDCPGSRHAEFHGRRRSCSLLAWRSGAREECEVKDERRARRRPLRWLRPMSPCSHRGHSSSWTHDRPQRRASIRRQ